MKTGVVYKIETPDLKYFYVGSTINPNTRFKKHLNYLKKNKHWNPKFQNVYNKYKYNNLIFTIIQEDIPINKLEEVEDLWMVSLKSRIEENKGGLNLRDAKRVNLSKESIAKMSATLKRNCTEERRAAMSKSRLGKKLSEETKKKMSNAHKKRFKNSKLLELYSKRMLGNTIMNGRKHSEETKRKMSESRLLYDNSITVIQLDINNNFIKKWKSGTQAAKELNYTQSSISNACNKNLIYKNCYWKFEDETKKKKTK